ncbi:hypothetical protein N7508_010576 [Penicillium antarcticum]|uniref:uncharacterized protein n=1 Tax=Penicillium antarcticum TaxID=416450 RepID=UPI0023976AE7|nr:uncharacterized protein N7508_010576 [Penicillium antarcticum]KAJ5295755.1 hypothetical protein N7508_010576 [Penicillium antarcticum]
MASWRTRGRMSSQVWKSTHISGSSLGSHSPNQLRMSSSAAVASESEIVAAQKNYKVVQDAGNFNEIQAARPDFNHSTSIEVTKSPNPNWNYGDGIPDNGASLAQEHYEIDPYAPDRPMIHNYRLLVSGIAPRPVGFLSTVNSKGEKNLSPFSYFQVIDHDPPMFIVGFSSRPGHVKDTYHNLKETGECVINTVSENMTEAVNAASIDAPYGVSEWDVSGLHEAPSSTVKPARVAESVFNIEGKVIDIKEFTDHQKPGMSLAATVLIKATRFWVKEGASDAEFSHIDLEKLRPIGQLGGMSYGRISSTFEHPRKRWSEEVQQSETLSRLDAWKGGDS